MLWGASVVYTVELQIVKFCYKNEFFMEKSKTTNKWKSFAFNFVMWQYGLETGEIWEWTWLVSSKDQYENEMVGKYKIELQHK